MKTPEMNSVASSNIESIGYDKEKATLHVQFRGGGLYTYPGVEMSLYEDFFSADSKGKFFHQNIRSNFSAKKMIQEEKDAD